MDGPLRLFACSFPLEYSTTGRCCDDSFNKANDHAETELAELKQHDPANHLREIHQPVARDELVEMRASSKVEAASSMPFTNIFRSIDSFFDI
jgi:hypothetical protein